MSAAERLAPVQHLGPIVLAWERANDDQGDTALLRHLHAETVMEGDQVDGIELLAELREVVEE